MYYYTVGTEDDVQMGGNVVGCLSVRYNLKPNCGVTCKESKKFAESFNESSFITCSTF